MGFVQSNHTLEEAKTCVGKGWGSLIDILYHAMPEDTHVVQVKEKYGGLRFYVDGSSEEFHDLIDTICWVSECICENCGKVGKVHRHGWWKTRCPACLPSDQPKE